MMSAIEMTVTRYSCPALLRIFKVCSFFLFSVADMAVQNVIGDACRGATWVAIHNGGGVGW